MASSWTDGDGGWVSSGLASMASSTVVGGANERIRKSPSLLFISWLEDELIVMLLMWGSEEKLLDFLVDLPPLLSLGEDPICLSLFVRMIGKPGVLFSDLETPSVPVPCFEYHPSGGYE